MGEALDLIGELYSERSHLAAAVRGWSRPADVTDLATQMIAEAVFAGLGVKGGTGLDFPWTRKPVQEEPVSADEVARLRDLLEANSAIRDDN